jgi:hypothetical protein
LELTTGERLECTFKQATADGVVTVVGGQSITIPLEKVRTIYLVSAPPEVLPMGSSPAKSPGREVLDVLLALESVTESGIDYRNYSSRVL